MHFCSGKPMHFCSGVDSCATIEKLMDYARKHSRYGHRDSTMILVTYRHGLRPRRSAISNGDQVELDHVRMSRPQGQEQHAIRPSDPGR